MEGPLPTCILELLKPCFDKIRGNRARRNVYSKKLETEVLAATKASLSRSVAPHHSTAGMLSFT